MNDTLRVELLRLQGELRRRGLYRPATARILAEWVYHLTLTSALAGWWLFEPLGLRLAALLVSTLGMLGISTAAHTAAHGAALPWRRANAALAYLGYPFMLMVSAHYWRHKHNVVHHPNPNVIGIDADCDLMPFFAMHESEIASARPLRRFYYRRLQGWVFPLAVTLNGFNVQRISWVYLLRRLRAEPGSPALWLDLGVLLAHVAVWIVLPCTLVSVGDGLLLYFLRIALLGHAMFCAFAPAHFPAEAEFIDAATADGDFVMRQTQTTVNFRTGWIGALACNGVEYQIEHHLFPGLCHVYYPAVAPVVRAFCETHGYPYRTVSWRDGILKSYAALFHPRPIVRMAAPSRPTVA
jgi:linoleoyl-CoA desaturase